MKCGKLIQSVSVTWLTDDISMLPTALEKLFMDAVISCLIYFTKRTHPSPVLTHYVTASNFSFKEGRWFFNDIQC